MSSPDLYAILEVDSSASAEELKKSYRRLARQYHPDTNPGNAEAEARFKEISQAYEILSDPDRRAHYDRFGSDVNGSGDFNRPKGVSVDSEGHVYVVEGLNDVVQIFDGDGQLLLDFGESGKGPGQFWLPSGIAIVNDIVYVADAANRRVQLFEYVSERRR